MSPFGGGRGRNSEEITSKDTNEIVMIHELLAI